MGQCCPGVGPGRIYEALRQATLARAAGPMDLSVLRLNFDPSRHFRRVYRLGALLGEGSFGSVCSCTRRLTGEERAVKQLLKSRMKDGGNDVLNELEILATLDHPNVLKFYEFFEDDLAVLAVTELCGEGDFSSLLPRGTVEEDVRLLYRDVMLGLAYCHSFGIVHRDLKLANCVIARRGPKDRAVAKIIDFGLAVLRREEDCDEEWLYETCGTAAFQAPEVLRRSYGEKCDVWSFGIMVLMQVKGSDNDPAQTASWSERYEKLELYLDAMSQELGGNKAFRLAQRLLRRDVTERPSAQAALESSWLRPPSVRAQEAAPDRLTRKDRSCLRRSLSAFAKLSPFDKVVLLMASNASRCQRSDFCRKTSKLFMSTDTDKSGFLNQEEVQRALAACGLEADGEQVEVLWHALDASEDGRVTHSEWVSATMDDSTLRSKTTAKELFEWLDFDGSGSVSLQELKRLVTDKEALEVLDSADSSHDGLLSFEEFTELIQSIASRRYGPDPGSPSGDSEQESSADRKSVV